jgi:dUTP pyrophosphatase
MIQFRRCGNHDLPLPSKAYENAAAFDMCSAETCVIYPGQTKLVPLGFAVDTGIFAGLLLPRSGLGNKGLVLGNLVGVIDPDFRGELKASLWNRNIEGEPFCISYGDKVCQLMLVLFSAAKAEEVFELSGTKRGEGGFGSSGVSL